MVDRPEKYRWNTLGYLLQTGNKDDLLALHFGLDGEAGMVKEDKIRKYRRAVYEIGSLPTHKGLSIDPGILEKEKSKDFRITTIDFFKHKTRYFIDSGVIGSKEFVEKNYQLFKDNFSAKRPKVPNRIEGLEGSFSLKRLSSAWNIKF